MGKAFGFIGLLFFAFVAINWGATQLQSLTAAYIILPPSAHAQGIQVVQPVEKPAAPQVAGAAKSSPHVEAVSSQIKDTAIAAVPFFSQFTDIQSPQWQGVGCGVASLAMVVDFYKPETVSVNTLLQEGIDAGAYDNAAGWSFSGLIQLAEGYGLNGTYIDLSKLSAKAAIAKFDSSLTGGPLILSVHYEFNAKNSLPHLIVVDGIKNSVVYYNDPAAKAGEKKISINKLVKGWEKKMIVLRLAK